MVEESGSRIIVCLSSERAGAVVKALVARRRRLQEGTGRGWIGLQKCRVHRQTTARLDGRQLPLRNTPLPQLRCFIATGRGVRELEGRMLTNSVLVVAVCGISATVPTLAHDEERIFQYSSIARLVGEGQYRAEVWRRENASDKEERAWSSSDLHRSPEQAIAAACTTLRESFASSCTQTTRNVKAGETAREPRSAVAEKSSLSPRVPPANSPSPALQEAAAASNPGSTKWAREFWVSSTQQRM
jgi:hypothetical protein